MLSDCRHLSFRNLNSTTVPVNVVRVKSYVNSLINSTRVPARVSVNKEALPGGLPCRSSGILKRLVSMILMLHVADGN